MILTSSLRILTPTLIKFSFFFLCFLWDLVCTTVRDYWN